MKAIKCANMIISIINMSGGVGKTTTAILIGKISTKKTLIIDATQEASLTAFYETDINQMKKHNLYTLIFENSSVEDCIQKVDDDIDFIPTSIKIADDFKFKNNNIIKKKLGDVPYSLVVFDTQPSFGNLNRSIINYSDLVLVPCTMQLNIYESADNIIKNIKKPVKILPTKYVRFWSQHRKTLNYIREECKLKNIDVLVPIRFNIKSVNLHTDGEIRSKRFIKNYKDSLGGLLCGGNCHQKN